MRLYRLAAAVVATSLLTVGAVTGRVPALAAAPSSVGSSAVEAYVTRVYGDLFGRSPDAAGLANWGAALQAGRPYGDVANGLTSSAEFRARLIGASYQRFLSREPDPVGLAGWLRAMDVQGLHIEHMQAGFIASEEFYARGGGNDRGWVASLYRIVLERDPARSEVDAWALMLVRGADRRSVAAGFLYSAEHLTGVLDRHYQNLLGRPIDPVGARGWVSALQGGARHEMVIAGLVASAEYLARVPSPATGSPPASSKSPAPAPPTGPALPLAAPPTTPPSTPAATEPPAGTEARPGSLLSRKKGVASYAYHSSDVSKLSSLHPAWSYNWSSWRPGDMADMEFVPMVWGGGSVDDATIRRLGEGARAGAYTTLLGFNEPDLSEQAAMTPEEAIALWPRLESTGLRLASPAPASPWNGWLERFMTLAQEQGRRVDVLALHYYQDFTDPRSVDRLRSELATLHDRYQRPIWITEIGAIDIRAWGAPTYAEPTHERADAYMREVVALLESLPYVERYAWFDDNCWHAVECRYSSLYDDRGALTSHGSTYGSLTEAPLRPTAVTARSSVRSPDWGTDRVDDGLTVSRPGSRGYSSDAHAGPTATEWLAIDLGRRTRLREVVLHPRSQAPDEWPGDRTAGAGFPVDFSIQVSDDGATWRTVRAVTGHPEALHAQSFTFAATEARWVRIHATRLGRPTAGESHYGGYRLQLAEVAIRRA